MGEYVPRHAADLIWRTLEDEMVIIRPSDGQVRVLNDVAAFAWQMIDGKRSIDDLVEAICGAFDVDKGEAEADLNEFMDQLLDEKLVKVSRVGNASLS